MNTTTELFSGFDAIGIFKLSHTLFVSIVRFDAVKLWNYDDANNHRGKYSGKEQERKLITEKLFEESAEPQI